MQSLLRIALAVVLLVPLTAWGASAPRPLSDAERAAVQVMTAYLSRGPAAVVEQLSAASPLRKSPALHDEIEARLGPPTGATWELQTVVPALKDRIAAFSVSYPSGLDDSIAVAMVADGGGWKVHDLRILAQPSQSQPAFPPEEEVKKADAGEKKMPASALPVGAGIVVALAGTGAALLRRTYRGGARLLIAAAAVMMLAVLAVPLVALLRPAKATAAAQKKDDERLAPLVAMRRTMAAGASQAGATVPPGCGAMCRDVAALWSAQVSLQQMQLKETGQILARFPSPSRIPLAEILRGRMALLALDEASSAVAWEHAVSLGPGRDGLWYEAAQAFASMGFEGRAEKYFRRLERVGSRDADVYYVLSLFAAMKSNNEAESVRHLARGWQMQPIERARLVEAAPLWSAIRTPEALRFISLNSPAEPQIISPQASTRPIPLPASSEARISGELLRVRVGEGEMLVPGGAALAPAGTAVADAAVWAREEEERGLADAPQLTAVARTPAALAQPALRRRFLRAVSALARRNRWPELLELTEGLSPKAEHVPPEIFFLRSDALQKRERTAEARQLMQDLAGSSALLRRRDADALEQLAEALDALDLFDQSVAMYDRAQAIRQNPFTDDRVRQIQMNKRLATKYSVFSSEHFDIRYPDDVNEHSASQIASIMESELVRLQRWVPIPAFRKTTVNVVWWSDFRGTYTGSDFILGFYTGKITVPFAGIYEYVPPVVALLTHELCHAMVGQATNHQAPRWFQEGLAVRVEMVDIHANAFNMYDDEKLIAVPLFDAVLGGSPDPGMITGAYIQSQTVIRFIESEFGQGAIARMIEQFSAGATTEEAILAVTRLTLPEFEAKLRSWGRGGGSRVFENPPPRRYDLELEQAAVRRRG